jgi:predicted nucleic acid-binding protein
MYLDTAILAKHYIKESGSDTVRAFLTLVGSEISCSELTRMELAATFHRKLREGQITKAQLSGLRTQFELDVSGGRIHWLPLTQGLLERVEGIFHTLPSNVFLRAGDAIHLATVSEAGFKEIYSNDKHLLAAAALFKLKGINPLAK